MHGPSDMRGRPRGCARVDPDGRQRGKRKRAVDESRGIGLAPWNRRIYTSQGPGHARAVAYACVGARRVARLRRWRSTATVSL